MSKFKKGDLVKTTRIGLDSAHVIYSEINYGRVLGVDLQFVFVDWLTGDKRGHQFYIKSQDIVKANSFDTIPEGWE